MTESKNELVERMEKMKKMTKMDMIKFELQ